jgi:nucleoside-diphosphate-sugar epimerase
VKQERLRQQLAGFAVRLTLHYGDLVQAQPFHTVAPEEVGSIIHTAAVTRFNVDADTADQVNLAGTEKLLTFAARCPALRGLGLLSTVYASGLQAGRIAEAACSGQTGFANHYERSKWAAETALLSRFAHLPWRIFRVATVIADDDSGQVTQHNAFHHTLKLCFYGLLSLIPGLPRTPLYLVTGRFVADAVLALMQHAPLRTIYHVTHAREASLCLGELIDVAFETFQQEADFVQRRILRPLYADAETFDLLVQGVTAAAGGVVQQAVGSVAPFAPQLFIDKTILNPHLVAHLASYQAPDAQQLVRNTCRYLVQTRWGRTPLGVI